MPPPSTGEEGNNRICRMQDPAKPTTSASTARIDLGSLVPKRTGSSEQHGLSGRCS